VTEVAVTERRLSIGEISRRLGLPVRTVARLFEDEALICVRDRGWRQAYESQVDYIAEALNACRPGSIADFAREWASQRTAVA
jgi:AraC-like DNA-binding protein